MIWYQNQRKHPQSKLTWSWQIVCLEALSTPQMTGSVIPAELGKVERSTARGWLLKKTRRVWAEIVHDVICKIEVTNSGCQHFLPTITLLWIARKKSFPNQCGRGGSFKLQCIQLAAPLTLHVSKAHIYAHQGLVLALCGGPGAEHRIHPGHTGVERGGGEPGQVHGRGRESADAGKETHRGLDRTGVQLCCHPGAKPPPALQHPADCLFGN